MICFSHMNHEVSMTAAPVYNCDAKRRQISTGTADMTHARTEPDTQRAQAHSHTHTMWGTAATGFQHFRRTLENTAAPDTRSWFSNLNGSNLGGQALGPISVKAPC